MGYLGVVGHSPTCGAHALLLSLAEVEQKVLFPPQFVLTVPAGLLFPTVMTLAASSVLEPAFLLVLSARGGCRFDVG